MNWGMQNRLARIIKPEDNRAVMLAVDHGYFLGPTSGLEEPRKTVEPLMPYADSIMLTRGVLRTSVDPKSDKPVVLRVSGGTSILKELSNEDITVSIDDCVRLNVSAMALSIFVGSEFEKETLVDRKSTRLNSSHEWISYAVFCLKKKKINRHDRPGEQLIQGARILAHEWRRRLVSLARV